MARQKTITSANSVFTISIPGLIPVPVQIQGFAVDAAFDMDAADITEVLMGVDGKLSAGYTPQPRKTTIHLQADSDSRDVFDIWASAMRRAKDVYYANASIVMESNGKTYTLTKGVLQNQKDMPDAKKVLNPTDHVIIWESCVPANI